MISASHLPATQAALPISTTTTLGGQTTINFFHIRHENLFVVACTTDPPAYSGALSNVPAIFGFLRRFVLIGKGVVNGKLDDDAVRGNFVRLYEVLDGKTQILRNPIALRKADTSVALSLRRSGRLWLSTARSCRGEI